MFQFVNNRYTTPQRVCCSGVLSASLPNSMSMRTCLPLGLGLVCPLPPPSVVCISLLFLSGADVLLMDHYCPWPGTLPNDAPSESWRSLWIRQWSLSDPVLGPHSSGPRPVCPLLQAFPMGLFLHTHVLNPCRLPVSSHRIVPFRQQT